MFLRGCVSNSALKEESPCLGKKHIVRLTDEERSLCKDALQRLSAISQKVRRAHILLVREDVWYTTTMARPMDEPDEERLGRCFRDEDEIVKRLVRLLCEDSGGEAQQSTELTITWSDLQDAEKFQGICSKLEVESSPSGFVVRFPEASPLDESEALERVNAWLDRANPAFNDQHPREFLASAERRRFLDAFVASLEGSIFS